MSVNEEEIKKIARETFIENVMNNLDSAIIFKYVQELEQENALLKDKIKKGLEELNKADYEYSSRTEYANIIMNTKEILKKEVKYEI